MGHFKLLSKRVFYGVCFRIFSVLVLSAVYCGSAIAEPENDGSDSPDNETGGFVDSLKQGDLAVSFRYRFEYVTDGTTELTGKDARASTLRTSLSYHSRPFHGFAGFVEFENVSVLGKNSFNNKGFGHLSNGVDDRPVVADVKDTDVNQVYFDLTAIPDTVIHAGREEILLDNQRFIGNVGWRQKHQFFDAVSVKNRTIPRTTVTYVHLFKVNRIFGDSKPMNSNLINVAVRLSESAKLVGYVYLLDYKNAGDFGLASNTFGFRLSGTQSVREGWNLLYDAEYAKQADGGNNPNAIDADYYRLEGGMALYDSVTIKAGHEVLGGSTSEGQFNTPLATLHAFNGWADKFLTTPGNGLKDTYVSLGGKYRSFGLSGIYHWFRSDTGSIEYGNEMNLLLTYKSPWKQTFGFKAAFYRADLYSEDTDKLMIYSAYRF